MSYRITGKSAGKHIVEWDSGRVENLSDAELNDLMGKPTDDASLLREAQREIDALNARVAELETAPAAKDHEIEKLEVRIENAQAKVEELTKDLDKALADLRGSQAKVKELEGLITASEKAAKKEVAKKEVAAEDAAKKGK